MTDICLVIGNEDSKFKGEADLLVPLPTAHLPIRFMTELSDLNVTYGNTHRLRNRIQVESFKELRAMGYKLQSPKNLKQKHLYALARAWVANGLST